MTTKLDSTIEALIGVGWIAGARIDTLAELTSSRSGRRIVLQLSPDGVVQQIAGEKIYLAGLEHIGAAPDATPSSEPPGWVWVLCGIAGILVIASFAGSSNNSSSLPTSTTNSGAPVSAPLSAADYRHELDLETQILGNSSADFRHLMAAPQPNDSAWASQVSTQLQLWHMEYSRAMVLKPPTCLEAAHRNWIDSLGHLNQAAAHFQTALDSGDVLQVELGNSEMKFATSAADPMANMLRASGC